MKIIKLKLHKEIVRLQKKGLSYRKMDKELIKNGFKIGKSPSTVHSIIKKMEKRDKFLRDKKGFKKYDYLEGNKELTAPYLHQELLNCNTLS